jgi:hypothetical protein
MKPALVFFVGAIAFSGCALLGKNDPHEPRYFTPEYDSDGPAPRVRSDLQLRLGRVEGWSHLGERMASRHSARELFYDDDRRWIERPEIYLRRALSRALFEERGMVESLSSRAITIDVELIAFEEIVQPHQARMQALLLLSDDRVGLLTETITVEQPVAKSDGADPTRAVVDAFSQALHAGVTRIADRVVEKLSERAPHATR